MFLKSTGVDVKPGSKLRITAQEFEGYMVLVGRAGIELLSAVSGALASTSKERSGAR